MPRSHTLSTARSLHDALLTIHRLQCPAPLIPSPPSPQLDTVSKTDSCSITLFNNAKSNDHILDPTTAHHSLPKPATQQRKRKNTWTTTKTSRRPSKRNEGAELGEEAVRWVQERKEEGREICVHYLLEEPEAQAEVSVIHGLEH